MVSHDFLLSGLVPRAAELRPSAIAAACDDERLTWAELDGRVGRLATALTDAGVGTGDRVGIYLHKSMDSLVAVHGVLRSGAAYVPIDPMAPTETIATIIEDCDIEALVTHQLRRPGVKRLLESAGGRSDRSLPSTIIGLEPGDDLEPEEVRSGWPGFVGWQEVETLEVTSPVSVLGDDLAYVMYTSGSTGAPKGIMHTHRSGLAYATMSSALYGLGPDDRVANFSPLHFDMSTFELLAGVAAGSRVVLVPEQYLRLPASLTQYIADQGCTTLYTVPSLFQQMLTRGALADRDLSTVRWVLPAGEVFPPEPLRELMAVIPHARFSNVYGPAEVNQCSYYHFDEPPADGEPLPIGYRCPDTELLVVDKDDQPITGPERGELLVRTSTMMAGYWNRPDLDRTSLIEQTGPGGLRGRWYRTGDIVSWDVESPSCLRYYGRGDNQIKIRGNRVELEMVEAAVASLDEIEHAVVGVRVDAGGDSQLVAYYVADHAKAGDGGGWRQRLSGRLASYAVPTHYHQVDRFPLTPSGKIDRRSVRATIAESGSKPEAE